MRHGATPQHDEELRRLATQVEADGWIPKGLTADELATRVRSICT